jgi:hypothetical protein
MPSCRTQLIIYEGDEGRDHPSKNLYNLDGGIKLTGNQMSSLLRKSLHDFNQQVISEILSWLPRDKNNTVLLDSDRVKDKMIEFFEEVLDSSLEDIEMIALGDGGVFRKILNVGFGINPQTDHMQGFLIFEDNRVLYEEELHLRDIMFLVLKR